MKNSLFLILLSVSVILSAAEPVAFLSDIQGKMQIERNGRKNAVTNSCEALFKDDLIIPGKGAEAKIIFSEAIYEVKSPSTFKVQFNSIQQISGRDSSDAKPVTRSIRGAAGDEKEDVSVLVPPREFVANVIPAITRATEEVTVYSPKGQLFSDSPDLLINGIAGRNYTAVLQKDGKQIGKTVPVKPGEIVSFAAFQAGKLQPDEMYELQIKFEGKIVNDPSGGSFYLLDAKERKAVVNAEKSFGSLKNPNSAIFFKANILYKKECYAETRVLAEKLVKAEPGNNLYRNLLKLANKSLGYKE